VKHTGADNRTLLSGGRRKEKKNERKMDMHVNRTMKERKEIREEKIKEK
jgi:hypothetical protein